MNFTQYGSKIDIAWRLLDLDIYLTKKIQILQGFNFCWCVDGIWNHENSQITFLKKPHFWLSIVSLKIIIDMLVSKIALKVLFFINNY